MDARSLRVFVVNWLTFSCYLICSSAQVTDNACDGEVFFLIHGNGWSFENDDSIPIFRTKKVVRQREGSMRFEIK